MGFGPPRQSRIISLSQEAYGNHICEIPPSCKATYSYYSSYQTTPPYLLLAKTSYILPGYWENCSTEVLFPPLHSFSHHARGTQKIRPSCSLSSFCYCFLRSFPPTQLGHLFPSGNSSDLGQISLKYPAIFLLNYQGPYIIQWELCHRQFCCCIPNKNGLSSRPPIHCPPEKHLFFFF